MTNMTNIDTFFLLKDDEGNNIAVISNKANEKQKEFNSRISLAIKEHFCADKSKIVRKKDVLDFSASITEDNETCVRNFTIEKIAVY